MSRRRLIGVAAVVGGLALSSVALGLPWDIDMADGAQRKAYSMDMGWLPEGVVAQPSPTSPRGYSPNFVRDTPEAAALAMPADVDPVKGRLMYDTYCAPCHGDGKVLGPVAGEPPKRLPGVSVLAGPNGVAHTRSDAFIYLTARNGGTMMPSYGWALSDHELWSIVAHIRTLDNTAYAPVAPAPAPEPAPEPEAPQRGKRGKGSKGGGGQP